MTETDKAYIAGFIDGEAYIGLMQRKAKNTHRPYIVKPVIKVAQIKQHENVLVFLKEKYGGHISKTRKHNNSRDSVMWEINNLQAIATILTDTMPYLKVKKEIAQIVLDFCATPRLTNAKNERNNAIYKERCILQKRCAKLTRRGLAETE